MGAEWGKNRLLLTRLTMPAQNRGEGWPRTQVMVTSTNSITTVTTIKEAGTQVMVTSTISITKRKKDPGHGRHLYHHHQCLHFHKGPRSWSPPPTPSPPSPPSRRWGGMSWSPPRHLHHQCDERPSRAIWYDWYSYSFIFLRYKLGVVHILRNHG